MATLDELQNQINELNNQVQQKQNEIYSLQNNLNVERNNFSNQTNSLQGQINDLSNQIQIKQNEINGLQNNFNNERNNLSSQINLLQNQVNDFNNQKQNEINSLNSNFSNERNNFNDQINNLNAQLEQKQNEINSISSLFESEKSTLLNQINDLNNQITKLEDENRNLNNQIIESTEKSIERLTVEYENRAKILLLKQDAWYKHVKQAFIMLGVVVCANIFLFFFADLPIEKRLSFFAIDIVVISTLWFCLSQYTYYTKLHTDYINRKVVAGSYLGVIHNAKDPDIKKEATKTIAETLFSRSSVEMGSEVPIKEVVKIVANNLK